MAHPPAPLGPKTLVVTGPARADIDGQLDYLARQRGIDIALRFAETIDAELDNLAQLGHSGVSREWLSPGPRMTVLGDRCIYVRVTATETRIVRFLRSSRDASHLPFDDIS